MQMQQDTYKLVRPDVTYEAQWQYAIRQLLEVDGKIIPGNLAAADFSSFLEQTQRLAAGEDLPEGYVPSELYFLVKEREPSVILGVTDLRLSTTPAIEQFFGHAGGSILPEYRKQGLGRYIIELTLDVMREKGFQFIILTCETWNERSRRAIIANGGVFQGTSKLGEKRYERYLIDLTER